MTFPFGGQTLSKVYKKMKNFKIILGAILLTASLVGAVFLVRQNQEMRKQAAFDTSTLKLLPSSTITANVGSTFPVELYYYTSASSKVDGIQTVVCYGAGVSLASVVVNTDAGFNSDPVMATNGACTTVVVTSMKAAANLATTGKAFTLYFRGIAVGAGTLSLNSSTSMMTGDNPASDTDKNITVSGVEGTDYQINGSAAGNCNRCSVLYDYMRTSWTAADCSLNPVGLDVTRTYDATCLAPAGTRDALQCSRCSTINDKEFVWWDRGENQTCADNPSSTTTIYRAPNDSCTLGTGLSLKFKVTFLGVKSGYGCAEAKNMPLSVIVRAADGTTKSFTNVIPTKLGESNSNGLNVYEVSLRLGDFATANNLAVFVKGPKHLQVKYGVNGQSTYYKKAGGELSGLTADETTTPVFSFEDYPLLAGDVTGATSGVQDGTVDGLDFSYVKTESIKRTEAGTGGYMLADLNGNCKMESQDVSLLMLSLSEKEDQLY
jgi:hypothetical protein